MATSRKQERRFLTKDEFELVERSRMPELAKTDNGDLPKLISLVRERRDRARDLAQKQRRQVRGKSAASGGEPGSADKDSGNRRKAAILAEALTRLTAERNRRTAGDRLVANARKALALKKAATRLERPSPGRTAGRGMHPKVKKRVDQIGSAMEAGRVSQFVRDAQAKRDAR